MRVPSRTPILIIGAGQAGLTMSRILGEASRDHVVVERRATLGGGWQDRWDGFRLVTPNGFASFPGQPYDGTDPDGFMPRDEIVSRVAGYAERISAPVALETSVERLVPRDAGGLRVQTSGGEIAADEVIVATGSYHLPRVPALAAGLPPDIHQLHSHAYRNAASLPPGAVLVVGSGQTGIQLTDELTDAGRRVFLAVGSNGWCPRRYRGRDIFRWLLAMGVDGPRYSVPLPTVDTIPDPRIRLAGTPQLTGHHGGRRDVSLRRMAAEDGVNLLGHIEGIDGTRVTVAPDLNARLARSEGFFGQMLQTPIDTLIERAGIDAPAAALQQPHPYDPPERTQLDLRAEGISTVLWTTGYRMDHSWIDAPIADEMGIPRQHHGVSDIPGLSFIGLLWQQSQASATLAGPALDAAAVTAHLGVPPSAELATVIAALRGAG
jgi:putative flavoprotein involved in K+ transport